MKIKLLLAFAFVFLINCKTSYSQTLSDRAEISIITCAPGDPLFSAYGHSALRVLDSNNKTDLVYNYGTFDFETPNFYGKFIKGQLDYMLSVVPYKYFVIEYSNEQRWTKEQVLNLSEIQKQKVYEFLTNNAKPENKFYRYDFFYDNCASRIKDVLKSVLKEELVLSNKQTELSFRKLTAPYYKGRDWGRFGTNLILGLPADQIPTNEQVTFLPDHLADFFNNSKVIIDGAELPAVKKSITIWEPKKPKEFKSMLIKPTLLFWGLFAIALLLTIFEFWKKDYFKWFDKVLFFIVGLTGVSILLSWFFTDHSTLVNNLNILWAVPFHLIVIFLLGKEKFKSLNKVYFLITAILALSVVLLRGIIPQYYDIAIIPFALLIAIRSGAIYFRKI